MLFSLILLSLFYTAVPLSVAGAEKTERTIKFSVIPAEGKKTLLKKFGPFVDYLSKELGVKIEMKVADTYFGAGEMLGENKAQIAFLSPLPYLKCSALYPEAQIVPAAKFTDKGNAWYKACIVVRPGSPIKNISELKGHSFAFGDPDSTATHLVPAYIMYRHNIFNKDIKASFRGSFSDIARAVISGKVDAGCILRENAEKYAREGKLRILATSAGIPLYPICVNKHFGPEMRKKLVSALEKLNSGTPEMKKILSSISPGIDGVCPAHKEDYAIIKKLATELKGKSFY